LERPSGREVRTFGLWRSAPSTRDGPLPNARVAMGRSRKRTVSVGGLFHRNRVNSIVGNSTTHHPGMEPTTGLRHIRIGNSNPAVRTRKVRRCVMQRRHFKQTQTLEERLADHAKRLRAEAKLLPRGAARDALIRRARQAETISHMSEWLRSPGLQLPE
jgi:hypothetical protein